MVVTDLDGTLLDSSARLGPVNRGALERLGEHGVLRVVATGRSLHSARLVIDRDFPIDYLVFSSGVGIVRWPEEDPLVHHHMRADEAL
ncbi:MAG: HAD hydrolase family protein, partial [Gammaproteobacteria bacterium]|nr:HAD hydrolase family protein [Gammaproteobacteria bacterium]